MAEGAARDGLGGRVSDGSIGMEVKKEVVVVGKEARDIF